MAKLPEGRSTLTDEQMISLTHRLVDTCIDCKGRIEELEAKLAKAVVAVQEAIRLADQPLQYTGRGSTGLPLGNRFLRRQRMTDYTEEHRQKLTDWLATHELPQGLGDEESACTLAAINLTLTGELTDDTPDCMSEVLGQAAIRLQDAMPDKMRNSKRYKALIPNMPGTGRALERERLAVLMDWMWTVVLPKVRPVADKHGFGSEWERMCVEKSVDAADAAAAAACAHAAARAAARAARAARDARAAADYAAFACVAAAAADADAAAAADYAAVAAADAAADADADAAAAAAAACAAVAAAAVAVAAADDFWEAVGPIGVLERMTYLEGGEGGGRSRKINQVAAAIRSRCSS